MDISDVMAICSGSITENAETYSNDAKVCCFVQSETTVQTPVSEFI